MIKILDPGLYSSIQDKGREGYQKYGVPISGSMDLKSSNFANFLLNNPINAALIEATQFGPKILFNVSTFISITGGNMNPQLNNKEISMNKAINGSLVVVSTVSANSEPICFIADDIPAIPTRKR